MSPDLEVSNALRLSERTHEEGRTAMARGPGVTCILNASACSNEAGNKQQIIADLFARHGIEPHIEVLQSGSDVVELVRRAVTRGSNIVVSAGGDGTVKAVAGALIDTDLAMGILPLGTLNHFAKDLQIPLDLELAVSIILTGGIIRIDVGEVNGHVFVNNSSLGIYPWVVRERENQQKRGYSKWHAFGRAALLVFKHYSPLRVRVRIDGDDQAETATPFIFIGNNRYEATGLNIGERKALTEGQLWVCRAPRVSRTRLLGLAFQCVVGVGSVADLEMFEAQQISVRSDRARLSVAVDGEVVLLETPLEYRIRRRALNVIVPAEVDDASE